MKRNIEVSYLIFPESHLDETIQTYQFSVFGTQATDSGADVKSLALFFLTNTSVYSYPSLPLDQ